MLNFQQSKRRKNHKDPLPLYKKCIFKMKIQIVIGKSTSTLHTTKMRISGKIDKKFKQKYNQGSFEIFSNEIKCYI